MNNQVEQQLLERARRERPALPDFEAMWERIQADQTAARSRPFRAPRTRLLPAAIALSSVLVAAPVVAGTTLGWDEMFDRLGISTALKSGFGNPLDITVRSEGASVSLKGVVTDEQQLYVPFTLDVPHLPEYDVVAFEQKTLTNSRGRTIPLTDRFRPNASAAPGQLAGVLGAEYGLGKKREQLQLSLQNVRFYKYKETALDVSLASLREGQSIDTKTAFGKLNIVSVIQDKGVLTLRYEMTGDQPSLQQLDPRLTLKIGDRAVAASYAAVLPPNREGTTLRQDVFPLANADWERVELGFKQLEAVHTIAGRWEAEFEADGRRTGEATYVKKLEPVLVDQDADIQLKQLVVTPLKIRILTDDIRKTKSSYDPSVSFDKMELVIDGQSIPGGMWETEKGGPYLNFESPEWYRDWSAVPMKLQLSEARMSKRSKDRLPLNGVSEERQSIETSLDGFPVTFTYYRQGQDLLIESESSDPRFLGISQTSVIVDRKPVYPEMNPMPPGPPGGGTGSNKRVERYPGLLADSGKDLQLNPGFYSYFDPERKAEIDIN